MKKINRDNLPYIVHRALKILRTRFYTPQAYLAAKWWGIEIGANCQFDGRPYFSRFPSTNVAIGAGCVFNSHHHSVLGGVSRPCIVATLEKDASIVIGDGSGFTGTVIGCQRRVTIGRNVRCATNTLIFDTDWHTDDPRAGAPAPVTIEDGVWLGIHVVVLKGVTIGRGTLVGANSLVTRSLPAGVIAGGVPARVLKEIDAPRPSVEAILGRGGAL